LKIISVQETATLCCMSLMSLVVIKPVLIGGGQGFIDDR
jgi:hypothetical protein